MQHLESKNIVLRPLEPSDIINLLKWENDPENWVLGIRTTPYSRHSLEKYILNSENDFWEVKQIRFAITQKSDGLCIGLIDIFDAQPLHLRAEVGILIDPKFRGNGFAFQSLQIIQKWASNYAMLKSLSANVFSENTASCGAFVKAGFNKSGILKSWFKTPMGWKDVTILQWQSSKF